MTIPACRPLATITSRRALLRSSSLLALGAASGPVLAALPGQSPVVPAAAAPVAPRQNRAPLASQPLLPLPAGSIRPLGWLRRQMEIQARGLGGRLDETWPDVGPNSGWLGGTGESWERGPYFLDGLLPLAWALDDQALKAKAQRFVDWTLASFRADGMFGPAGNDDWWPRMVMLKVLTQYHELTGDPRVVSLMTGYFHHQLATLPTRPLKDWGRFRWQDELLSVLWLYNRTGDEKLIALAHLLGQQGWDWRAMFADFPFTDKVTPEQIHLNEKASGDLVGTIKDLPLSAHGVNNAMGIKASAVWSLVSNDPADRAATAHQLALLDRYHGMPTGMFAADEHLAGRSPSQGVELCAVVETLFSLEQAMAVTGDSTMGDRIERIGYNALPAAFTDDMWSHQYDQQPNQIRTGIQKGPWTTNGDESNMFGLEPHFGCCTANFHQGWPKLLNSVAMGTADGGVAVTVYAPARVATRIGEVAVTLTLKTDYPFRDTVAIVVEPVRDTVFPLRLRVPGWATGTRINVNGRPLAAMPRDGFVTVARTWRPGDRVDLTFDIRPTAIPGYQGSVSVAHGPLLYVLPIGERWDKLRQRGLSADWTTRPTDEWNYGLPAAPTLRRVERPVPPMPFTRAAPAAAITVAAVRVPAWQATGDYASPPPVSPVARPGTRPNSVTLIPYGAAKLRITAFPVVQT